MACQDYRGDKLWIRAKSLSSAVSLPINPQSDSGTQQGQLDSGKIVVINLIRVKSGAVESGSINLNLDLVSLDP